MKTTLAILLSLLFAAPPLNAAAPPAKARLGMNLSGPADYATELPFVDVFRTSRPWISQKKGEGWGKGPELAIDKLGWMKKLDPGCYAESMLCTISGGHYPAGIYTVLYEGEGKIEFGKNARVIDSSPGLIHISVDSAKGGFSLHIRETDPKNYIRNIHVIMPGYEKTWQDNPFHPAFLKRWQGFACFRFMDWMHTNGSTIAVVWADCQPAQPGFWRHAPPWHTDGQDVYDAPHGTAHDQVAG